MVKTATELAAACENLAKKHKTLYVMGCFGAPMNESNKQRYTKNHSYNRQAKRTAKIEAAAPGTFGFDCVCMIKGLLWGWTGDKTKTYGGATYASNNVPDVGADKMITLCKDVSTNFSSIQVGEVVWMRGHIGVYIGGGLAVECTPIWKDGVQVTAVHNIGRKAGYNGRTWTKHGKLPYVSYEKPAALDLDKIAREVINGKYGTGSARRAKLAAKYGADVAKAVQQRVNEILLGKTPTKSVDEIAREVINGKYGTGSARRAKLTAEYGAEKAKAVQQRVNDILLGRA